VPDRHAPAGRRGARDRRLIGARYGETPVAVITAFGSADNAVAALKAGAFDYLAKPVALEQLRSLIKSALNLPRGARPAAERRCRRTRPARDS
jgi:two-component system response regulator PilR (NtrC family)